MQRRWRSPRSTARHHMLHRDGLLPALDRPRWHAHDRKADLIDQADLDAPAAALGGVTTDLPGYVAGCLAWAP